MNWCCVGFKSHYQAAGERGSAILIGRNSSGKTEITMQYRAVNIGEETQIESQTAMSLITDVGIKFCPWCGRNATEWYSSYADELFRRNLKITY
jgi:hypothetical protein